MGPQHGHLTLPWCFPILPGGAEGGALESVLRPVERYAVRFVELEQPTLDKEQLAAQVGGWAWDEYGQLLRLVGGVGWFGGG